MATTVLQPRKPKWPNCLHGAGEQMELVAAEWDPCPLPRDSFPICGSDGITYDHPSTLDCLNLQKRPGEPRIEIVYMGKCKTAAFNRCIPSSDVSPLCGTDGLTYSNPNALRCVNSKKGPYQARILIAHKGRCQIQDNSPCYVTWEKDPLCGSDGQTYQNPSHLKCSDVDRLPLTPRIMAVHPGKCIEEVAESFVTKPPCYSKDEKDPVCGSDGQTYDNLSHFICENSHRGIGDPSVTVAYKGECQNFE